MTMGNNYTLFPTIIKIKAISGIKQLELVHESFTINSFIFSDYQFVAFLQDLEKIMQKMNYLTTRIIKTYVSSNQGHIMDVLRRDTCL